MPLCMHMCSISILLLIIDKQNLIAMVAILVLYILKNGGIGLYMVNFPRGNYFIKEFKNFRKLFLKLFHQFLIYIRKNKELVLTIAMLIRLFTDSSHDI